MSVPITYRKRWILVLVSKWSVFENTVTYMYHFNSYALILFPTKCYFIGLNVQIVTIIFPNSTAWGKLVQ